MFGGRTLSSITTADIRAFAAARLEAEAAPAEINRELAIVRRAFRLAVEADKYHGRVPKIRMLQEHNVRTGFVDDAMIDGILGEPTGVVAAGGRIRLRDRLARTERDTAA